MYPLLDTTVAVGEIPPCYFCGSPAAVDAEVNLPERPWAYMCEIDWTAHGLGVLGLGRGQRLVLRVATED